MARKPEANFWQTIKSRAPRAIDLHRVENVVEPGMPDVFGRSTFDFWIELKAFRFPARDSTTVLRNSSALNKEQVVWLKRYARKGGQCFVLTRDIESKIPYLFEGSNAKELNQANTEEFLNMAITNDWEEIWKILS